MDRRHFMRYGMLAPFVARSMQAAPSTPVGSDSGFNQIQVASTWVDSREDPLVWYSIRITAFANGNANNPYHWMTDPNAVAQEHFDAQVERPITLAEYPLPEMGGKIRHDATYRIRQGNRIGPYIISVKDNVILQQASVAFHGVMRGEGNLNGPADAPLLGCIARLTELDGSLDVTQIDSIMPTQDELDEGGLDIRIRNEYLEL